MHVKCIDDSGFEDQLQKDEIYQVLEVKNNSYKVKNTKQEDVWYGQSHFAVEFF